MTVTFQPEDAAKYDCKVLEQGIDVDKIEDGKLPTDTHLVEYMVGADTFVDIVRAHKMSDIFDAYFDKISAIGKIIAIKAGYGKIRPNLYGTVITDD